MKYHFVINLICLYLIGNISLAQQKKPISPKKPTTTVKTTPLKTAPKTNVISKPPTTTTTPPPPIIPKVEEKKPVKTTVPSPSPAKADIPDEQPNSTTVQQSTGPLKGNKLEEEVKEPKSKKVKMPKIPIEDREIKFGVRAEATQHYTLEVGGGTDVSLGVNVGILANLPISEQVSIQPEVLFSLINIQSSTDDNNYIKSSIGSILVPLMFNFNFGKNTTKFMLNLGGYADYGLSQSTKVISLGKTVKDGSVDLGNDRFDYGLGVGVGVKLNNKLMVEARSFYGMKDNINKNGFGTIGVGYFF
jgi:outer membrane immunogenic protein